jgi:hypothetical protein
LNIKPSNHAQHRVVYSMDDVRASGLANEQIANQRRVVRSRSALPTTLTDESARAAPAIIGESSNPNVG